MSERQDFLNWKINKGMYGWSHECAKLVDEAYERGKAAREKEGGEVVATIYQNVEGDGRMLGTVIVPNTTAKKLPNNTPLYTHPPQSQGVPEGFCLDGGHRTLKANAGKDCSCPKYVRHPHCDRYETRGCLPSENPWLSVPAAPQADEWVKCSNRLPTEADDDYQGCVWVHFEDGDVELMEAEEVEQTWDDDISITHWMPTGLTRPHPPEQVCQ